MLIYAFFIACLLRKPQLFMACQQNFYVSDKHQHLASQVQGTHTRLHTHTPTHNGTYTHGVLDISIYIGLHEIHIYTSTHILYTYINTHIGPKNLFSLHKE